MQYRYFECSCGNNFNEFVEIQEVTSVVRTGVQKIDPHATAKFIADCPKCQAKVESKWNDPKGAGTKLYFDYMER